MKTTKEGKNAKKTLIANFHSFWNYEENYYELKFVVIRNFKKVQSSDFVGSLHHGDELLDYGVHLTDADIQELRNNKVDILYES